MKKPKKQSDKRELFNEISAIMQGIMDGFSLTQEEAAELLENNKILLLPKLDSSNNKYILASFNDKEVKLYLQD